MGSTGRNIKKVPLKILLILPFIILMVLTTGLVGYLSFQNGKKAVNTVAFQLRSEIANRIEDHLDKFLKTPQQINRLNAVAIHQGVLNVNNPKILEHHFWEQIDVFNSVTSIYFGNTEGGLVNSGREGTTDKRYVIATENFKNGPFNKFSTDPLGNRADLLVTVNNFDARTREWYKGAVKKGADFWSPAYILFTGQDMAIAASRPVYDKQHKLLGVVSVDLFLSHISNFLRSISIGKQGNAFIIERSGLLVASSSKEIPFIKSGKNQQQRRLHATESNNPEIRYAAKMLAQQFDDFQAIKAEQNLEFKMNGQRRFLQVVPVSNKYGLDWLIAITVSEKDFMGQIDKNNNITFFLIFSAFLLAILFGLIISKIILTPILRLNMAALNLADGEWENELRNDYRAAEISVLTQSFNRMSGQLRAMLNNLNYEIEERKQAEDILIAERNKLEIVTQNAGVGLAVISKEYRTIWANKIIHDIFGDVNGKSCHKIYNQCEDICPECGVKEIFRTGKDIVTHEQVGKDADGNTIWSQIVATPIREKNGTITSALEVVIPITKRKLAEEAIINKQKFLDSVIDRSPFATWIFDAEGTLQRANPALFNFLKLSEEHLIGKYNILKDINAKQQGLQPLFRTVFDKGETISFSLELDGNAISDIDLTDSKPASIEGTLFPIHNAKGELTNVVSQWLDVTKRIQLEEQLRQSLKMESIGTLTGGVAHDFNNILGIIIGNTELALDDLPDWHPVHSNLEAVKSASIKAAGIVKQLLSFSRKTDHKLSPVEIISLVKESLTFLKSTIPTTIDLRQTLPETEQTILADPIQINQIMMNLCINASQAMEETGGILSIDVDTITLTEETAASYPDLKINTDYIRISVSDSGPGISADIIENIFDPYFTTKEVGKGSGMGLAVVHGIVKNHNGAVFVECKPGKGTIFKIYFPLAKGSIENRSETKIPGILSPGKETILFVDDEKPIVKMVSQMLGRIGYNVQTSINPVKALELFRSNPDQFDLVITDMTMPQMTGVRLSEELREIREDIPIIICSGHSSQIDEDKVKNAGISAFIMKPVDKTTLLNTIRRVLDS